MAAHLEGRIDPEVLSRLMEYEAMMQPKREKVSGFLGESDFDRRYREILDTMPPAKTKPKEIRVSLSASVLCGAAVGLFFGFIGYVILKFIG